jgi:hypothetical protein
MATRGFDFDAFRDLLEEASLAGTLAAEHQTFNRIYQAFRAGNPQAFQAGLRELGLLPRCGLVCEWIRIKECFFLCLALCGPPTASDQTPNQRQVAEAIVKIGSNRALVEQLVAILDRRDSAGFRKILDEFKLGPFCHLFCHWLCVVRYRLICRFICSPRPIERPNLAVELQTAAQALRQLLEQKGAFEQAAAAANAGDTEKLASIINNGDLVPYCHYICEWFCSWRCTLVCLTLCRQFPPVAIKDEVAEALAFAKAAAQLSEKHAEVEQLIATVGSGDATAWMTIVRRLKLEAFCIQLCNWICTLRCRRFCVLVCPPPSLFPQFTSIGGLDYLTAVNSASGGNGLTVGDNRAFFNTLRLNGILSQTLGGLPMEYRFETRPTDAAGNPAGPWTPVLPAQIAKTVLGHWERLNPSPPPLIETQLYIVNAVPGPNERAATISADGWIQVPQENNFASPAGAFFSNGNMIELITQTLAPFGPADETGVTAGGPAKHPLVQDLFFGIRMRVRQQGVPGSETDAGTCVHIAIDDTLYNNITLHPDWDGGLQPAGQLGVCMLDVNELIAHPCSEITNTLTVVFTAAHPNLGPVSITLTGPGGPFAFTLPPIPETGDYFGTAMHPTFTVSNLKPCAYLITLSMIVLLTNGDGVPDPLIDQIAFCKK